MLVSNLEMKDCYRNILLEYNELYGDASMLERAKSLTINPRCRAAIERLEQVYEVVCQYGYEKYISFDLGMVNHYDYYTGIIFRGYTFGTGDAIGKGGRYDNLLVHFGKNAPAIGFTILVDDMLSALDRQKIGISLKDFEHSVLLYQKEDLNDAISFAVELRNSGVKTELLCKNTDKTEEKYVEFARSQGAQSVFSMAGDDLTIYDFTTEKTAKTSLSEFRKEY